ncbi:hypothetical protein AMTR_s00110p00135430 [Amborella trichopoda]|uniref:DUF659 domain-containing protein n=1 Tax=Amborella trichopoda TaxID=13333 RepID=W1NSC5_AMBTC|nr:hypothetical protein AMTR_s00110p00135430 [Amborella trichopoda]
MYQEESDDEKIVSSLSWSASIAGHDRIDPFLSKPKSEQMTLKGMIVEEVGDKHVVQFITDNARACVSAGSKLMDKRKHLIWTRYAAHSIDLMLEEIGEIKIVNETLQEARLFKKKEIIRPVLTRFTTDYLAVDSIQEFEGALKRLFTSEEWCIKEIVYQ